VVFGDRTPNRLGVVVSGEPVSDDNHVNPATVDTLPEFAAALQGLRGTRSYAELDKIVNPNHGRQRSRLLPASTLNNLLHGKAVPSRETLTTFLKACGLAAVAQEPWLAAWERVGTAHLRRPAGAVRVRDGRPRLLGVHASIRVDGSVGELPAYVPRDLDADLRTAIIGAAEHGGFVLLVGGSSVGKTRALFEAIRVALPDWWLIHPDSAEPEATRALAAAPTPRTVAWLDELQHYLTGGDGLSAGRARSLITGGIVLAATLWPEEYTRRSTMPIPGQPDPHADERQLLGLARVIRVPEVFSAAERCRAEALASDRRIRVALDTPDAGFTQVLAAGPELVSRWEHADPYSKAVITAALDARRVGAYGPLTRDLLEISAPAYLTPTQQASAPSDWLGCALAYATTTVHGAAACLTPVPAGMGVIGGYTTADYLHQHALCTRRTTPLPGTVWQAIVGFHHPEDTLRVADNAIRRGRVAEAESLYRQAASAGDAAAASRLAELLSEQGRIDDALTLLQEQANAGDRNALYALSRLLLRLECVDDAAEALVRQHADVGDMYAANQLASLLWRHGRVDELRQRADAGDDSAALRLASLLAEQGNIDELRQRADAGNGAALYLLTMLLTEQGRADDATALLRQRADAGHIYAAQLLAEQGCVDEATMFFRRYADAGDTFAAHCLGRLLAREGRVGEATAMFRRCADVGDTSAAHSLVALLAEQCLFDELRQRADAGDTSASHRLAELLAAQGLIDELRQRADAGETSAAQSLAGLLAAQGRVDELRDRADAGDTSAAHRLPELLAAQGLDDELRQRADAGNTAAAIRLADLLTAQRRVPELVDEVAAGTVGARERLARLLGASRARD
jgi:hypothetical protein